MATPNFPVSIPGVVMEGYGFTLIDTNQRTEMDAGLPRVRRRFRANPVEFDVTWKFTSKQFNVFEHWFLNDIYNGSAWFNVNLVDGKGQRLFLARFKGVYQATAEANGRAWVVTAKLEVAERTLTL
jgi:hypothetical protein